MSDQSAEEVVLRRYLLADLDEQQREQMEERVLSDDDFADELSAAESSLVDDYVFDALSPGDREKFEQNFILNDERRKNLLLSQAFEAYVEPEVNRMLVNSQPKAVYPWWKKLMRLLKGHKALVALSAAAVVLLILFTPKIISWLRLGVSMPAQRASVERQMAEYNRRPFTTQSLTLRSLDLTLQPTLLRGGSELTPAKITEDVRLLNLRLALLEVNYSKYTVVVRTVEGVELFAIDDLSQEENRDTPSILVRIPSELLPGNDYQLALQGIAADGAKRDIALYNLRVIKASS